VISQSLAKFHVGFAGDQSKKVMGLVEGFKALLARRKANVVNERLSGKSGKY
jgi:hypothetical protein